MNRMLWLRIPSDPASPFEGLQWGVAPTPWPQEEVFSHRQPAPPFPWVTPSRAGSWRTNSSMFGPLPSLPTSTPTPSSAQPAVTHAGLGPGSQAMFPGPGHGGGDKGKRSHRMGMESRKQGLGVRV